MSCIRPFVKFVPNELHNFDITWNLLKRGWAPVKPV